MTNQLCVISDREKQKQALTLIDELLDKAQYPMGDIDIAPIGEDDVEMTATLLSTSVNSDELEKIAEQLVQIPYIKQAYWNPSTSE